MAGVATGIEGGKRVYRTSIDPGTVDKPSSAGIAGGKTGVLGGELGSEGGYPGSPGVKPVCKPLYFLVI